MNVKPKSFRLITRAAATLLLALFTTATAWADTETVSYIDANGQPASHDAIALDGMENTLNAGWYFVGTNISYRGQITCSSDVNLILADGCTLDVKGIYIPQGSTLTIYAQSNGENAGSIVSHPTSGAAIGGMTGSDNGNIVICGGNIEATGADYCAGIGSAEDGDGGSITIYGGTVTAKGGKNGAAIGGGDGGDGGTITIYGGTVTAKGGNGGAAIGGGRNCDGGTITIYGGTITANDPTDSDTCENGAGIGGGDCGDGGTITIYGGTITTYSRDGAGIGGGDDGNGGTITINGGKIVSTKVNQGQGARIGGGCDAAPGTITINGGTITAVGGAGAGIGGGKSNQANGTVTINGGDIDASGNYGIGAGEGGADVAIILGWTSAADRIYASTYGGTVTIADGKAFHNGSVVLEPGEVTDKTLVDGKTLVPYGIVLTAHKAPDQNFWTTYYNSTSDFTIDGNACAYTATYGGDKLTLNKLGKEIPAGTAVIIVADNSVVSMTATTDGLPAYSGTNDLRGVDTDTPVASITSALGTGTFYVLGMTTVDDEHHFGFHRYTGSEMAAHKAFVLVGSSPSQAAARSLTMVFDEASGIESAEADSSLFTRHSSLSTWFTLDGRRLQAKPTKSGIYVNNGKKVVIK